jgi:hypothetical protein
VTGIVLDRAGRGGALSLLASDVIGAAVSVETLCPTEFNFTPNADPGGPRESSGEGSSFLSAEIMSLPASLDAAFGRPCGDLPAGTV